MAMHLFCRALSQAAPGMTDAFTVAMQIPAMVLAFRQSGTFDFLFDHALIHQSPLFLQSLTVSLPDWVPNRALHGHYKQRVGAPGLRFLFALALVMNRYGNGMCASSGWMVGASQWGMKESAPFHSQDIALLATLSQPVRENIVRQQAMELAKDVAQYAVDFETSVCDVMMVPPAQRTSVTALSPSISFLALDADDEPMACHPVVVSEPGRLKYDRNDLVYLGSVGSPTGDVNQITVHEPVFCLADGTTSYLLANDVDRSPAVRRFQLYRAETGLTTRAFFNKKYIRGPLRGR